MAVSFTISLRKDGSRNYKSGFNGSNGFTLNGSGFGSAPTVTLYKDWTNKTVGARAVHFDFDSGLYGATNPEAYPFIYDINGVSGVGSRAAKGEIIYTITAQSSTDYKITIPPSAQFSINSGIGATQSSIVAQLVAAINADSSCLASASGTTTLKLTRKTPSVPFAVYNATEYPNAGYDTAGNSAAAGINMVSDYGLTGFIKLLPTNPTDFFVYWRMGVPTGYFFSGATSVNTNPPESNLKMNWFSDQPLDSAARADIVGTSRNAPTEWSMIGNQSDVNIPNGGQLDFGRLNSFRSYHKAGASPFIDNGQAITKITGLSGTTTASQINLPLFARRSTFTITVQSTTLYTVTISGTLCSYISSGSATAAEICNGLVADITAKVSGAVGVSKNVSNDLVFDPVVGTTPTITNSGNLSKFDLIPQFTQVSTLWQGNNNQVNSLHVFPDLYIAIGANCGNYVAIGNSATESSDTDIIVYPHASWSDTQIVFSDIPDSIKQGRNYYHRYLNGILQDSGVISWQ